MINYTLLKRAFLLTGFACTPLVFHAQEAKVISTPVTKTASKTIDSTAAPVVAVIDSTITEKAVVDSIIKTNTTATAKTPSVPTPKPTPTPAAAKVLDTAATAVKEAVPAIPFVPTTPIDTSKAKVKAPKDESGSKSYKMSLGAHLGTSGIGLQYNINLSSFVVARAEGSYIGKKNYIRDQDVEGVIVTNDISVTTGYIGLFGDFHVPGVKWLNLTIGGVYDLTTIKLHQTLPATDLADDLGSLTLETNIRDINPYVGLMFGRTIPKILLNTSFQIGTYYIGSPTVTWTGDGLIGDTADQADIIDENIKNYSWMPVMSLHLNFKIK